jgi:prepilin-type N-terminal cleavage/methylation domain-containing protein
MIRIEPGYWVELFPLWIQELAKTRSWHSRTLFSALKLQRSSRREFEGVVGFKESLMRKQKGFSLIELLIVVAIILIIAAIAIPNLLRSRIAANEASAVGSMRTINTAEITYASTYPSVGYSANLANLAGASCGAPTSTAACLIDATLAGATAAASSKSGYFFTFAASSTLGYTIAGTPAKIGSTGVKQFYTDGTAVIHYNMTTAASATDAAIQ